MYKKEQRKVTWGMFLRVVMETQKARGKYCPVLSGQEPYQHQSVLKAQLPVRAITAHKVQQAAAASDMLSYL